jgi:hypothetical protein
MFTRPQSRGFTHTLSGRATLPAVVATSILLLVTAAQAQNDPAPISGKEEPNAFYSHMSEDIRASIDKIVVIASPTPPRRNISGDYEKDTLGVVGGANAGVDSVTINKEIAGVPISLGHPIFSIPAAIIGGISGASKRRAQELQDALTDDLAKATDQPLTTDGLGSDVYFGLRSVPGLQTQLVAPTTPIAEDTDAILYVNFAGVAIDIDDDVAILSASADATVRRLSDGRDLYERKVMYQDRDTLENWIANDNALWHDYANFARHFLGREVAAEVFDRIQLKHELEPRESDNVDRVKRNDWQGVSKSTAPTLAWELTVLGGKPYGEWVDQIDESAVFYDVEVYDTHTLVYAETLVQGTEHTLLFDIEPCKTYRWSVRPSYRVDNSVKFGEWMRRESDADDEKDTGRGSVGRQASVAPAYIQDFASLEIACPRK